MNDLLKLQELAMQAAKKHFEPGSFSTNALKTLFYDIYMTAFIAGYKQCEREQLQQTRNT